MDSISRQILSCYVFKEETGQILLTSTGSGVWVCPPGVYSVSAVAVGPGGGGQSKSGYVGGGGGGGGVVLFGQGSNGAGGIGATMAGNGGGHGGLGSGPGSGYGGGGPGAPGYPDSNGYGGMNGAIRIIWPGTSRQFPSTRTGNE